MLALLFLIGFLGFGIGVGGGPGGIFDALGISNSSNTGSSTAAIQDQIDAANAKLAKDPNDTQALLKLADNEFLLAKTGVETDPTTGQPTSISNDAHTALGKAADAWNKYLKVNKGEPDVTTAFNMVNVFQLLGDAEGLIQAQKIVAQAQPSAQSYGQLALFQYLTGDLSGGDASRKKAIAEAPKSQRKTLESQLDQARKQGEQVKKQQEKAQKKGGGATTTPGANPLENPFGGVAPTP
jgi:hypothetical protein